MLEAYVSKHARGLILGFKWARLADGAPMEISVETTFPMKGAEVALIGMIIEQAASSSLTEPTIAAALLIEATWKALSNAR